MSNNDYKEKPDLADQHWRMDVRRRSAAQIHDDFKTAIENGHLWRIAVLLKLDPKPERFEEYMVHALHLGRDRVFDLLAAHNPEFEKECNIDGFLRAAATAGKSDMFIRLCKTGRVDIHQNSEEYLRVAADHGHKDIVAYLLSLPETDVNIWNGDVLKEASRKGHLEIVELLVKHGADLAAHGEDAFLLAARNDHPALMRYFVDKGIISKLDEALTYAAGTGMPPTVQMLVDLGANVNHDKCDGLMYALRLSAYDNARILLTNGADINAASGAPLREAINRRDLATVLFLLDNGARSDYVHLGQTPLMQAAGDGQPDMVEALLEKGADHMAQQYGAIRTAHKHNQKRIARQLRAHDKKFIAALHREKQAEFEATFGAHYTLDDLRTRKGPSGASGLLIAAETGLFAAYIKNALDLAVNGLRPSDFYHPDDGVDTVFSVLKRDKGLQQFFDPAFWIDRQDQLEQAYAILPPNMQKRVSLMPIHTERNQRILQQKTRNSGFKPFKP